MSGFDYISDPKEIYNDSFAQIRAEADLGKFSSDEQEIAIRMIHACGMVDLVDDLMFSNDAVTSGRAALADAGAIFCDVEMVKAGIIKRLLPRDSAIICSLNDKGVQENAVELGTTRSAAAVEFWQKYTDDFEKSIIVIGNAPTALFHLLDEIAAGHPKPALIIGCPVGFVGAMESKDALIANDLDIPFIALKGRRGGSAIACSALNALAGGLG
jgi:precorrin-8X/cobalt-precorrin-8 methylmutase